MLADRGFHSGCRAAVSVLPGGHPCQELGLTNTIFTRRRSGRSVEIPYSIQTCIVACAISRPMHCDCTSNSTWKARAHQARIMDDFEFWQDW